MMHTTRFLVRMPVVALLLAVLSAGAFAQTVDAVQYEAAITLANGRLQIGNNGDAFTQAVRAIGIDPTRFEGYYFAALALSRQNHFDRALPYARDALSRAPADKRKVIEDLIGKAELAERANEKSQEARIAESQGKLFDAAKAYTEAFDLASTDVEAGQSATRLWLVLQDPATAARVRPSDIDLTQIGWLAELLSMENRPGVMLIAGDAGINLLTGEKFS
jgi:tetratricopeptide (TPR) repeat protein